MLDGKAHRASMISAIQEEARQQRRVAGHAAGTEAGRIRAFRQAGKDDEVLEVASQPMGGLERAERRPRLVEIDLGITLVRGDDEAVTVGVVEQLPPGVQVEDAPA